MKNEPLEKAIDLAGGVRELASQLPTINSESAIYMWRIRGVPVIQAIAIEKWSGGKITAADLRPDVFGYAART